MEVCRGGLYSETKQSADFGDLKEYPLAFAGNLLENLDGKKISLPGFRGKKKVVLVFYRGHW